MDKAASCVTTHKLNSFCLHVFEAAATYAASRFHYEVTIEHVLIKLLECHGGDSEYIFRYFKVNQTELRRLTLQAIAKLRVGNQGKPGISAALSEWIDQSWIVATGYYHETSIRSVALLDALSSLNDSIPFLANTTVLDSIIIEKLRRDARQILRSSNENSAAVSNSSLISPSPYSQAATAAINQHEHHTLPPTIPQSNSPLNGEFKQPIAQLQGMAIVGRDAELHDLINVLCQFKKNNPILVGEAGVGKSTLLNGLVVSINAGEVPDALQQVTLQLLDKHFLQTHIHETNVYEQYLLDLIVALKSQPAILVIEDLHEIFAVAGEHKQDFLQVIIRLLAAHEIRMIMTTTQENFQQLLEPHAELMKYVQPIMVCEPSLDTAVMMLNNHREHLQRHHQIFITDEAITAAVELSHIYLSKRCLPEKALTVLDAAAAFAANSQKVPPARVAEAKSQIACLEQRLENIYSELRNGITGREKILGSLQTELDDKITSLNHFQQQWQREQEMVEHIKHNRYQLQTLQSGHSEAEMLELKVATLLAQEELAELQHHQPMVYIEANEAAVTEIISSWTGIATPKILQYRNNHDHLAQRLAKQIVGQEQGLAIIARNIQLQKISLINSASSTRVFLFVGAHGVGKTACATALAEELYGDKQFLATVDLKSYQHANSISALCTTLCAIKQKHSNTIILLEEIDKVDPAVVQMLCQLFNSGICRNEHGDVINFRQVMFILTTAAGCEDQSKINDSPVTAAASIPFTAQDKSLVASLTVHPLHPQHANYRRSFSAVDQPNKSNSDESIRSAGSTNDIYNNNDFLNVKSIEPHQHDRYAQQNERYPHDRYSHDRQNISDRTVQHQIDHEKQPINDISLQLRNSLLQYFSPRLLACVQIVPFHSLTLASMNEIVLLKLHELMQHLLEKNKITFHYVAAVVEFLVNKAVTQQCGAWFIDRVVDQYLLPVIAEQLLHYVHDDASPKLLTAFLDDRGHICGELTEVRQYEENSFADLSVAG